MAAIVSYAVMIGGWLLDYVRPYIGSEGVSQAVSYLCMRAHAAQLASGIFSLSTLTFFISLTALMLGLTRLVLEGRRTR